MQNQQNSVNFKENSQENLGINSQNAAALSLRGDKVAEAIYNGKDNLNSTDCFES